MKKQFIIIVFVAVALLGSATVFAQNAVDSLFFRDGRVEGVVVSRSTSDMIQFSYPNETLLNEIQKSELVKIKYGSGRIEQFSTVEDALPVPEPKFVGEVYLIKENNGYNLLDKEVPQYKHGRLYNKVKLKGAKAELQTVNNGTISFIVKASDNQSDPMSIITIYRFNSGSSNRKVTISTHDNIYRSKTLTKSEMPFTAEKYGRTSYIITATNYENGEYGITVYNPNNVDEKKTIFNCIGIGGSVKQNPVANVVDGDEPSTTNSIVGEWWVLSEEGYDWEFIGDKFVPGHFNRAYADSDNFRYVFNKEGGYSLSGYDDGTSRAETGSFELKEDKLYLYFYEDGKEWESGPYFIKFDGENKMSLVLPYIEVDDERLEEIRERYGEDSYSYVKGLIKDLTFTETLLKIR